ncbi:hypothetical protein CQ057_22710 [Ochrobactrum sp. MYb49]|nr:hypothetical protein CQ057_22710 [Ochrobactrum sp. MYb49]
MSFLFPLIQLMGLWGKGVSNGTLVVTRQAKDIAPDVAKRGITCLALVFPFSFNVEARLVDGSDLLEACLRLPYIAKYYAIGTTRGLDDLMSENKIRLYCAPSNLTGDQKADAVCRYMKETPNARHLSMDAAVASAMAKAYRCSE